MVVAGIAIFSCLVAQYSYKVTSREVLVEDRNLVVLKIRFVVSFGREWYRETSW